MHVIRHSYSARFGKRLLTGSSAAAHLRQCSLLAGHVPVCRLARPAQLNLLPELARMVADDLIGQLNPVADPAQS
jgi:hypothetical protein